MLTGTLKITKQLLASKVLSKLYIESIVSNRILETQVSSKDKDDTQCKLVLDGKRAMILYEGELYDTGYTSKEVYRYFSIR